MDYDPALPLLAAALNPFQAQIHLQAIAPTIGQVTATTLVRHKPGRRALIAYHLDTASGPLTLLGKMRAKGMDWNSYHLQQALWHQGFAANSGDRLSVPEPMGVIPAWQMWLQRQVPGVLATDRLSGRDGVSLAQRIAALAHKLHQTPQPTTRTHTLSDELAILRDRLSLVSQSHPAWAARIETVMADCQALAARTPMPSVPPVGIHRDFYGDQVLVDGDRLWLLDLDLYCNGYPALDIGNFIAHMTEQSLRQTHDPTALADQELALQEAFVAHQSVGSPGEWRGAIALYTVLALVRHIHISTRIPERRPYTEAILSLCEARLGMLMA